jgi:prevent-host-death family protein
MSKRNRVAPAESRAWQVQEAKARFSEMLERAVSDGPQFVTKHGKEAAVLLSVDAWRDLEARARPSLKELLMSDDARTDELVPPRRKIKLRPPVALD